MIRSKYMLCAQLVSRDGDTNVVSAFGIMEGIGAEGFPVLVQNLAVIVVLERDQDDAPVHQGLLTIALGDTVLVRAEPVVDFADKQRTRQIVRVGGLVVPAPGQLVARFSLDGTELASYSVEVLRHGAPEVTAVPSPGA